MKNLAIYLLVSGILVSCTGTPNQKDSKSSNENDISEGGNGLQLDLRPITHGDTPVWWGVVDDVGKLEALLDDLDVISESDIRYKGESILSFANEKQFAKIYPEFQRTDSTGQVKFKGGSGLVVFSGDRINFVELVAFEQLSLGELEMSDLKIADAAKKFPKSYSVRNFYGDTFRSRFYDNVPNSYDHLILKVSGTNMKVHVRFIDEKLTHFSIE